MGSGREGKSCKPSHVILNERRFIDISKRPVVYFGVVERRDSTAGALIHHATEKQNSYISKIKQMGRLI
jgi:hypothetical protein